MLKYFGSVLVPGVLHFLRLGYTPGSKVRYTLIRVHFTGLKCREITFAHSNQNIYTRAVCVCVCVNFHGNKIPMKIPCEWE